MENRWGTFLFLECIQNFDDGECGEPLATAEIPAAPINTVEEAVNDAQTLALDMIVQIEHPALGMARSIGNPIKFSETPVSYRLASAAARQAYE